MHKAIVALFAVGIFSTAFASDVNNPQTNASALTSGTLAAARGGTGVSNSANLTVSSATSVGRGQYQAINTNTPATAGNVGEVIANSALNQGLASGTALNVTSVSLTAGIWLCSGAVTFVPNGATTTTFYAGWISTTSATQPTGPNSGAFFNVQLSFAGGSNYSSPVGIIRYELAGTTTVYLGARSIFAISTQEASGAMTCWRTN